MFERPSSGERAVLVHLAIGAAEDPDELAEFRLLAESAGAEPVAVVTGTRAAPDSALFVGSGKADEIRAVVEAEGIELALFNHTLSPSQERNLERLLKCRVVDRTGLILDIFAQRARSFEGKLQVELAQLRHLSTRLVRGWTHLERQKGGIGLRGPGETQLETDRRLIGDRISALLKRLEKVGRQREQGRRARHQAHVPTVSLVGYTNAGKSTLFNRLTSAEVYAADQLFATLDPTLRRLTVEGGEAVVLADTVGFIRQLPHDLVAAFRSTLQETSAAELLIHVIDAADPRRDLCTTQVNEVLREIGAEDVRQIEVYNKLDQLEGRSPRMERDEAGRVRRIWLSARSGEGVEQLVAALAEFVRADWVRRRLCLGPADGRMRSRLYAEGRVLTESVTEQGGWMIEVELPRHEWERIDGLKERAQV